MRSFLAAVMMVAATVGIAEAQAPFTLSWPHNPMVETYTVYKVVEGTPGQTVLTVVTADQCTGGQCVVMTPEPTVRTCYPILSMGLFQSSFNEIELCWRPRTPPAGPASTTGAK
jgi:hypothetical protein